MVSPLEGVGRGGPVARGFQRRRQELQQRRMNNLEIARNRTQLAREQMELAEWAGAADTRRKQRQLELQKQRASTRMNQIESSYYRQKTEADMSNQLAQAERAREALRQEEMQTNQAVRDRIAEWIRPDQNITPEIVGNLRSSLQNDGINPDEMNIPSPDNMTDRDKVRLRQTADTARNDVEEQQRQMRETRQRQNKAIETYLSSEIGFLQQRRRRMNNLVKNNPENELYAEELKEINQMLGSKVNEAKANGRSDIAAMGGGMTPNRIEELNARRMEMKNAENNIQSVIQSIRDKPSLGGITGTMRGIGETVLGSADSLTGSVSLREVFGDEQAQKLQNMVRSTRQEVIRDSEAGRVDSDSQNEIMTMFDPRQPQLKELERTLAYEVARMRKPGGRLNTQDVENAMDSVKITGATSPGEVYYRMRSVLREIRNRRAMVESRLSQNSNAPGSEPIAQPSEQEGLFDEDGNIKAEKQFEMTDEQGNTQGVYWDDEAQMFINERGSPISDDVLDNVVEQQQQQEQLMVRPPVRMPDQRQQQQQQQQQGTSMGMPQQGQQTRGNSGYTQVPVGQ